MRFFQSWQSLAWTALSALVAYAALILFLRVTGKRTLAKMSAFDLVVTVALGSTLASIVTSDRLPLANGLLALASLIALQYTVAWGSLRAGWFRSVVRGEPTLLFYRGELLEDALRRTRIGRDEILYAIRNSGRGRTSDVGAVVLEPDGSFGVIPDDHITAQDTSLQDVPGAIQRDAGVGRMDRAAG
jgi:uncharacterized membrane protein YcaP (DUF421 family)